MATTGSCVCKNVTYTFTGEPVLKAICHCKECQALTGSAFTYNLLIPKTNFTITSGSPKQSAFQQEIGIEVRYKFCEDCGTTIYKEADPEPFAPVYLVQAGTVDGGEELGQPDVELWTTRRPAWIPALVGVAQKAQF